MGKARTASSAKGGVAKRVDDALRVSAYKFFGLNGYDPAQCHCTDDGYCRYCAKFDARNSVNDRRA